MTAGRAGVLLVALATLAVSATAARALRQHGRQSEIAVPRGGADSARVDSFLRTLGASDPLVCAMVADQIGNFWTDEGRDVVGRFADAPVPLSATRDSLHERISDPRAHRLLEVRLDDANSCVRRAAARLLQRSTIETSRLSALLTHASPAVREAAAYALADEDRRASRAALERVVQGGHAPEAAMAAWALGEQGDLQSLPVLVRALASGEGRVRYAAAHAIGDLDDLQQAPDALVRAVRSDDATLRHYAGEALAEIEDPATVDALIGLVRDDDAQLRRRAIEALGNIGSPKAIPVLTAATRDRDAEVRRAAVEALGEVAKDR